MEECMIKKNFPVETKTVTAEVLEKPTEFLVSKFSNKLFIIITQVGKVGNLIEVTKGERFSNEVYNIRVLLGKDQEELHAAARFLMNYISTSANVLFALSLKDYTPETLKKVGECLRKQLSPATSS